MTRRGIITAAIVGLVFAIASGLLVPTTLGDVGLSFVAVGLAGIAAGIAGRVILGRKPVHRYFRLGMVVFSAIAGIALESAVANWLVSQDVSFGPAPKGLDPSVLTALIVGIVAYLLAAFVYGFAATRQGVAIGGRIGLLLLLLLAVLPFTAVPGFVGLLIVGIVRKDTPPARAVTDSGDEAAKAVAVAEPEATATTPEPPAASV
jgi:hypothetical protein